MSYVSLDELRRVCYNRARMKITFLKADGKHSWLGAEDGRILYTENAETYALPRGFGSSFSIPKMVEDRVDIIRVPIRTAYAGPDKSIDVGFADGRWYVFDTV